MRAPKNRGVQLELNNMIPTVLSRDKRVRWYSTVICATKPRQHNKLTEEVHSDE